MTEYEHEKYGLIRSYNSKRGPVLTYRDETKIIPTIKYIQIKESQIDTITLEECIALIEKNESKPKVQEFTVTIDKIIYTILYNPVGKYGAFISYRTQDSEETQFVNVKRDFKEEDIEKIIKLHEETKPRIFATNRNVYKVYKSRLGDVFIMFDDGEHNVKLRVPSKYKYEDITIRDILTIKIDSVKTKVLINEEEVLMEKPKKIEEPKPVIKKKIVKEESSESDELSEEIKEVKSKKKVKK